MRPHTQHTPPTDTSWQKVSGWYHDLVGDRGQYYHDHVVLPGVIHLLGLKPGDSLLDLACGNGVLARRIPKDIRYTGIDSARTLIATAKLQDHNDRHQFFAGDVTKQLPIGESLFTHAAIVLAIQNIEFPGLAFKQAAKHLEKNGTLVIAMNHPSFRIPRQSSWGIDEKNKLQYRRINLYMSPLKIPVTTHPGKRGSEMTWSFHHPLSDYTKFLHDEGFMIENLEEWQSDKESFGKAGKMENRGRAEFPLFLAIKARKMHPTG